MVECLHKVHKAAISSTANPSISEKMSFSEKWIELDVSKPDS